MPFGAFDTVVDPGSELTLERAMEQAKITDRSLTSFFAPTGKSDQGLVSKKRKVSEMTKASIDAANAKLKANDNKPAKTRKIGDFFYFCKSEKETDK